LASLKRWSSIWREERKDVKGAMDNIQPIES
jgi:hypothetical protein